MPLHTFRLIALITLAISLITPIAAAQRSPNLPSIPEDPHRVPLETALILEAIRHTYTTTALSQRVDVTVKLRGTERTESYTLRTRPAAEGAQRPAFELALGKLLIWSTDDSLHAVHTNNATDVVTIAAPDKPLVALKSLSPPIPAPGLQLALGADVNLAAPTPYTPDITWRTGEIDSGGHPTIVRLLGESSEATVELTAASDTFELRTLTARIPREDLELRLLFTPAPQPNTTFGVDIASRRTVASITDLAPHAGDLTPGKLLPDLGLRFGILATDPEPIAPPAGPVILIFFRTWTPQIASAITSARELAARIPEDSRPQVISVAVLDLKAAAAPAVIPSLRDNVAPGPLAWTTSPTTTIERFDPRAQSLAVVVDSANAIAGIIAMDARHNDEIRADLQAILKP